LELTSIRLNDLPNIVPPILKKRLSRCGLSSGDTCAPVTDFTNDVLNEEVREQFDSLHPSPKVITGIENIQQAMTVAACGGRPSDCQPSSHRGQPGFTLANLSSEKAVAMV